MVTKPLSRNEMRARAITFAARWKDETSERGQSQTFWTEFLDIYGVDRKRVALFEQLDRVVLAAYGLKPSATDAEVLSALFTRYEELVAPMIEMMGKKRKKGS